jgi:uncharacterized protein YjbI with pentapeptide repeats
MESLSAERQEKVQKLMALTGIEDVDARLILQENDWQLETDNTNGSKSHGSPDGWQLVTTEDHAAAGTALLHAATPASAASPASPGASLDGTMEVADYQARIFALEQVVGEMKKQQKEMQQQLQALSVERNRVEHLREIAAAAGLREAQAAGLLASRDGSATDTGKESPPQSKLDRWLARAAKAAVGLAPVAASPAPTPDREREKDNLCGDDDRDDQQQSVVTSAPANGGPLRERVICDSASVDFRRHELQALLVRPGGVFQGARLGGQDLSNLGFAKCSLRRADLSGCTLTECTFDGADMVGAKLQRAVMTDADLSDANLQGANLSDADLSRARLTGANLSGCNLTGATLPWSSGLMESVKLAGATGCLPADRNMSQAKLKGADLSGTKLKHANLSEADLKDANLSKADLSEADMSNADLSGANLRSADLTAAELSGARLCGAMLEGARGGRAATVQVRGANALEVFTPVVVALTAVRALRLRSVAVVNQCAPIRDYSYNNNCAKRMEVCTGPAANGPWTSVATFTSAKTKDRQTFPAAPDAPALCGFVQVLVHDTYGGLCYVNEVSLEGEAWGPAA